MWGLLTSIDLKKCDSARIQSEQVIQDYVKELLDLIKMRAYGNCKIVFFGDDPSVQGFTMVQMIETSLLSAHFVNLTDEAYIDIFSCKHYDVWKAALFTKEYFRAEKMMHHQLVRGAFK